MNDDKLKAGLRSLAADLDAPPGLWRAVERRASARRLTRWAIPAGSIAAVVIVLLPLAHRACAEIGSATHDDARRLARRVGVDDARRCSRIEGHGEDRRQGKGEL